METEHITYIGSLLAFRGCKLNFPHHALLLFIIIKPTPYATYLLNFSITRFPVHVSTSLCHMSQLSWLKYKGEHGNLSHSGRNYFEASNETELTFHYADGTLASPPPHAPPCEYFP